MIGIIQQHCDEGVIRSSAARSLCTRKAGPWVLAATSLGSSMAFIDGTAVTVALPTIQSSLGATAVDAQWFVEAYKLVLAALVLVCVALGDHLRRRRVFAAGDVRYGSVKRVASAVGSGAIAVQSVHEYLGSTPHRAAVTTVIPGPVR
jgi:MFS family permease